MKFSKEWLMEGSDDNTISCDIIDTSRWSVIYLRIFEHEGKFYRTSFSKAATEIQDESPYEYEGDEIECEEVFPVQVTVTEYKSQIEIDRAGSK